MEVDDKTLDNYYAIARGKTVGIFTEWKKVQEHMKRYPNPLYKKHSTYENALEYFKKLNKGEGVTKEDEPKAEKRKSNSSKREDAEENKAVPQKKTK